MRLMKLTSEHRGALYLNPHHVIMLEPGKNGGSSIEVHDPIKAHPDVAVETCYISVTESPRKSPRIFGRAMAVEKVDSLGLRLRLD